MASNAWLGGRRIAMGAALAACVGAAVLVVAAAPDRPSPQTRPAAATPPARGGRGGGIPGATPEQASAIQQLTRDLAGASQAVAAARAQALAASLMWPRDEAAIKTAVEAVRTAELAEAHARAEGFARIQASAMKLSPQQATALAAGGGRGGAAAGGGRGGIPHMTSTQVSMLTQLTGAVQGPAQKLAEARAALGRASVAEPRDDQAIRAAADAVAAAEQAVATARADAFAKIQESPGRLAPDQIAGLVGLGGVLVSGSFSEPQPLDFNDHEGYVSLFDGKTLDGWDGNPKFWRVEDGAIVGESTPQNPSGNTYMAYRKIEAHDFTLKFEIKVEGSGGSGIQYRSKTGIPWLTPIAANVTANTGPVNLDWMMTGPQADFWPVRVYTGQFYSENTPMRIQAWRGQVVEGAGMAPRRLMANIGDREALGKLVKMNDWNEYTVIARGPTLMHIVNGQLMAVMIDDDPTSSNNWSGQVGIEIEATTKVSVRNIWIKKLN